MDVDGVSLYVRQTGPDDGVPVLMLHGLLGTTEVWRYNRHALPRQATASSPMIGPAAVFRTSDGHWITQGRKALAWRLLDELGVGDAVLLSHSAGQRS
ncbi:MAG: hypothetical protein R2856_09585 [Caldilineaceae bacterium]